EGHAIFLSRRTPSCATVRSTLRIPPHHVMARRASSGISLGQIAGIAFAILGFFVIAGLIVMLVLGDFLGGSSASSGGGAGRGSAVLLDLDAYIQDANSLRGNVYRIEGKVEETLRWTSDRGRL